MFRAQLLKAARFWARELRAAPVKIVSDGATAQPGVGEGKLFPVLILDASDRPDISELVRVHQHLPTGDVFVQWGKPVFSKGSVVLELSFVRPFEIVIPLEFNIVHDGVMIYQILASRALYIQPGRPGDRVSTTVGNPRILVEVSSTGFESEWERMSRTHIMRDLRSKGLGRSQAKQTASLLIEEMRRFGKFRAGEDGTISSQ